MCGCGRKGPGPAAAYERFFAAVVRYSQHPHPAYQREAFQQLSKNARGRLEEAAEGVNQSLPAGVAKVEPWELLIIRRSRLGDTIDRIDVLEESADVAVLEVVHPKGRDRVRMVTEDSAWRVDLFADAGPALAPASERSPSADALQP